METYKWKVNGKFPHSFFAEVCGFTFKDINVNPKNLETGDCAIQAIVHATGKDYLEVLHSLHTIAEEECNIFNSEVVLDRYLGGLGFKKITCSSTNSASVGEFLYHNKEGAYIITVVDHMTFFKDGVFYDRKKNLTNPDSLLEKKLFRIYTKEENINIENLDERYSLSQIFPDLNRINKPRYPY